MKMQFPLFSEVVLVEDLSIYGLKRGAIAKIVEHLSALFLESIFLISGQSRFVVDQKAIAPLIFG
jgi:hypothetical protein